MHQTNKWVKYPLLRATATIASEHSSSQYRSYRRLPAQMRLLAGSLTMRRRHTCARSAGHASARAERTCWMTPLLSDYIALATKYTKCIAPKIKNPDTLVFANLSHPCFCTYCIIQSHKSMYCYILNICWILHICDKTKLHLINWRKACSAMHCALGMAGIEPMMSRDTYSTQWLAYLYGTCFTFVTVACLSSEGIPYHLVLLHKNVCLSRGIEDIFRQQAAIWMIEPLF